MAPYVYLHPTDVPLMPWVCPHKSNLKLSHKSIYNFPIKAPFMVLHINGYQAGRESGFEGSSH